MSTIVVNPEGFYLDQFGGSKILSAEVSLIWLLRSTLIVCPNVTVGQVLTRVSQDPQVDLLHRLFVGETDLVDNLFVRFLALVHCARSESAPWISKVEVSPKPIFPACGSRRDLTTGLCEVNVISKYETAPFSLNMIPVGRILDLPLSVRHSFTIYDAGGLQKTPCLLSLYDVLLAIAREMLNIYEGLLSTV